MQQPTSKSEEEESEEEELKGVRWMLSAQAKLVLVEDRIFPLRSL